MKRVISSIAATMGLIIATTVGCRAEPQASNNSQKAPPAAAKPAAPPKAPVVFTPAESSNAADTLNALKEADASFKDYTLGTGRDQMELRDIGVTVLNSMEGFTEPMTSSTPGRFEFGGQGRAVSADERNKVTEEVRKSTVAYLEKSLRVTKGARYQIVVALSAGRGVRILNGFDPYGIEIFRIYLMDTTTKTVIWCDGREGYGKTLDAATKVAADGVPQRLDVLFGVKK